MTKPRSALWRIRRLKEALSLALQRGHIAFNSGPHNVEIDPEVIVNQDVPHPVEAETLAGLVPDDVGDLAG